MRQLSVTDQMTQKITVGHRTTFNDIFSLNNQEFSQYTAEIYPKELTFNKSNLFGTNCTVLSWIKIFRF